MAVEIGESIVRAAKLFALVIVPESLSPEPSPSPGAWPVVLSLTVLVLPIVLAVLLRRRTRTPEALAAAIAWPIAVAVLFLTAVLYSGSKAPLLRGYPLAAPFVWGALALTMATLLGHLLGSKFKNRRMFGAIATLAIGLFLFQRSRELIASPRWMWMKTRAMEPGNELALEVSGPNPRSDDLKISTETYDACLKNAPTSCLCQIRRAAVHLRTREIAEAKALVAAADKQACARDTGVVSLREVSAEALALSGDPAGARAELGSRPPGEPSPRVIYLEALIDDVDHDPKSAEPLARQAVEQGEWRDARLLLAAVLIENGSLDEARPVLASILEGNPDDPDALYDDALLDDKQNHFNEAREGYLKALKQSPGMRDARYNLTMLTLRQGIREEARHHARKFVESYPDDPRGKTLLQATGAGSGAK